MGKIELPPSACHPERPQKSRYNKQCKPCYYHDLYLVHGDEQRDQAKQFRKENPGHHHALYAARREEQPERYSRYSRIGRLRRYGLTLDDFDNMMAEQSGVCAICGSPPKKNSLQVDHDHLSEAVRGLLCASCNALLCVFENPPCKDWLDCAEEYLYGD